MKSNTLLNIPFLAALTGSFVGLIGCSNDRELGTSSEVQQTATIRGIKMPAGTFNCPIINKLLPQGEMKDGWRYFVRYNKQNSPNPMPTSVNVEVYKNSVKVANINAPISASTEKSVYYKKEIDKNQGRYIQVSIVAREAGNVTADVMHKVNANTLLNFTGFCDRL
jgi:hypothetical protein